MKYLIKLRIISFVIVLLLPVMGWTASYYVDPINGNINNDGSSGNPWSTLQEVFEIGKIGNPVQPGDTILLRSGNHGHVQYKNAFNADYITIEAQSGHTPKLERLNLEKTSNWIFKGLTISPEFASVYEQFGYGLVRIWDSNNIIVENNNIFSVQDASSWTADDWLLLASRGIYSYNSSNVIIRSNTIKNVNYGVGITFGDGFLIEYNKVEHNIGDGVQVCAASDVIVQYNTLKNFYNVNNTHVDGIQFYHLTYPPCDNVILKGNLIIHRDPGVTKFPGSMQGIGCFDGPYTNWLVENNVVITPHLHGIAIYEATDSTIINNIAFHPTPTYPTIGVWIHAGIEDQGGNNTVIRNNMANVIRTDGVDMTIDHNIDIDDYGPDVLFVDYLNNDLRHKPGSPAIDAGNPDLAPLTDLLGNLRDALPDVGCYEYGVSIPDSEPEPEPDPQLEPEEEVQSEDDTANNIPDKTVLRISNNIIKSDGNSVVTINCDVKDAGTLTVKIYDAKGREIITLWNKHEEPGTVLITWTGLDASGGKVGSGIYLVHMECGSYKETKKIAVVK